MSKLLITGGAGFIGSNYLNIMVKRYKNDFFVCLDSLTYAGNLENIREIIGLSNFKFVKGDIRDKKLVQKLFEDYHFNYIINFAAETHVDNSFLNEERFMSTNVDGVKNLLEISRKFNLTKFHQVSTDEVYGDLNLDSNDEFYENSPLFPKNPYSKSKAIAEQLVIDYSKKFGLPITISRCTNNFGKNQNEEKFIPHSIKLIANEKNIELYGNGKNIRDWIYVNDHVEAIDLIVRSSKYNEIYNIAGHNIKSNIEIANYIIKVLHKDLNQITFIKDRIIHDLKYNLNTEKIEKELGFKCKFDFETELTNTISYYYKLFK